MARNNDIVITAGLNIEASEAQIRQDLAEISKRLGNNALQIKCSFDMSGIDSVKAQLNKLSQNIKINPIIPQISDNGSLDSDIDSIIKKFDLMVSKVGSKKQALRDALVQPIEAFKAAYQSGDVEKLEKAWVSLASVIQQNSRQVYAVNEELLQQQEQLKSTLKSIGKVSIDKTSYNDLKALVGSAKDAQKMMSQVFGVGNWTTKSTGAADPLDAIASQIPSLKIEYNNIAEAIQKFHHILTADPNKTTIIDSIIEKSGSATEAINTMASALKLPQDIYSESPIGLVADIEKLSELGSKSVNGVEQLNSNIQTLGTSAKEAETAVGELFAEAAKAKNVDVVSVTKMETTEATLAAAKEQIENATRISQAQEDATDTLQKFTVQVEANEGAVEKWKFAINETGDAYEYLGKTIREADNSTDFRRKDVSTQWEIQTEKLRQFISNAEKAGVASTELKADIDNLKAKLETGGDTSAMNAFLLLPEQAAVWDTRLPRLLPVHGTRKNGGF